MGYHNSQPRSQDAPPAETQHDGCEQYHEIECLQQQVRPRAATRQGYIGYRHGNHLEIHGQNSHLCHRHHWNEISRKQQGYKQRQGSKQCHQHGREQKQRHLHLFVHRLVGLTHVMTDSR